MPSRRRRSKRSKVPLVLLSFIAAALACALHESGVYLRLLVPARELIRRSNDTFSDLRKGIRRGKTRARAPLLEADYHEPNNDLHIAENRTDAAESRSQVNTHQTEEALAETNSKAPPSDTSDSDGNSSGNSQGVKANETIDTTASEAPNDLGRVSPDLGVNPVPEVTGNEGLDQSRGEEIISQAPSATLSRTQDLSIPPECAELRHIARNPRKLQLYRKHFNSLDKIDWFLYVSMFDEAFHERAASEGRTLQYLDIAANHAKRWSNTYFFDRCMGWSGICVEPNVKYHAELDEQRTCSLVTSCLSDRRRTVTFALTDAWGGVMSEEGTNYRGVDLNKFRDIPKYQHAYHGSEEMQCQSFDEALSRIAEHPQRFDFMSLDVETYELQVLKGINWNTTLIDIIVIENRSRQVVELLQSKQYKRYAGVLKDDIYIRRGSGYSINGTYARWLKALDVKTGQIQIEMVGEVATED